MAFQAPVPKRFKKDEGSNNEGSRGRGQRGTPRTTRGGGRRTESPPPKAAAPAKPATPKATIKSLTAKDSAVHLKLGRNTKHGNVLLAMVNLPKGAALGAAQLKEADTAIKAAIATLQGEGAKLDIIQFGGYKGYDGEGSVNALGAIVKAAAAGIDGVRLGKTSFPSPVADFSTPKTSSSSKAAAPVTTPSGKPFPKLVRSKSPLSESRKRRGKE